MTNSRRKGKDGELESPHSCVRTGSRRAAANNSMGALAAQML